MQYPTWRTPPVNRRGELERTKLRFSPLDLRAVEIYPNPSPASFKADQQPAGIAQVRKQALGCRKGQVDSLPVSLQRGPAQDHLTNGNSYLQEEHSRRLHGSQLRTPLGDRPSVSGPGIIGQLVAGPSPPPKQGHCEYLMEFDQGPGGFASLMVPDRPRDTPLKVTLLLLPLHGGRLIMIDQPALPF